MLRSIKDFIGYNLNNKDQSKGHVADFLFDDTSWKVRYVEVDLGALLPGEKVLLAPEMLLEPDPESGELKTLLSSHELENLPSLKSDKPVSMQWEQRISALPTEEKVYFLGRPYPVHIDQEALERRSKEFDYHLRSFQEVRRYTIESLDAEFGAVDDLIVDTGNWDIKSVILATRKWLPGKRVMMSPEKVVEFDWINQSARVPITRNDLVGHKTFYSREAVNPGDDATHFYDYSGRERTAEDIYNLAL